jgi:3-dehydroquinate synthase
VPTIKVHLAGDTAADRSYDILIGAGIVGEIGTAIARRSASRAVVISDAAVEPHAAMVTASLAAAGIDTAALSVPSGERSKSLAEAGRLWEALATQAVDRQTHVVAVGGGVVGDLAGFIAATFARGLPVWQVPTTLVAQVDSAIGGKTGINLEAGKNLVGCFWQPCGVFADIDTLATLPAREFTSGLAEVVKYGMILDAEFFAWLEGHATALVARDPQAVVQAVERSAALKAHVVARDEREETGLRAVLNYGHTFAHAFETAAGYGRLLHGEAVSIGMGCAVRLAERLGRIESDIVARQDALLAACGLPRTIPPLKASTDDLLAIMARDKKSLGGRLRFILPDRIGHVSLVADIDPALVTSVLASSG